MPAETRKQTLVVATTLCLVCSVLVSTAAVVLRPIQQENKKLDIQRNILKVAGIYDENKDVASQFRAVESELVLLPPTGGGPGLVLEGQVARDEGYDLETFDSRKDAKSPDSVPIPDGALPQIAKRETAAFVYKINGPNGELDQIILPIYGKGLWSTLYGFIAIDADRVTIRGITFYEHGETPGLGGEVENETWKAQWSGKKTIGDIDGKPIQISVKKGQVVAGDPAADYQVDGLSGATITSNGVTALVRYWLGPRGFGPYLSNYESDSGTEDSDG